MTFAQVAADWLDHGEHKRGLKYGTLRDYRYTLNGHLLPALSERDITAITRKDIERWHGRYDRTRTATKVLVVLGAIFRFAQRLEVTANPLDGVERHPVRYSGKAPALELAERGIPIVAFSESNARVGPASERLHAAIVEGRLIYPDNPDLNGHVRQAVARDTPRGWRIDKLKSRDNIDAVVALAMAVEAAENKPAPVELLGWP